MAIHVPWNPVPCCLSGPRHDVIRAVNDLAEQGRAANPSDASRRFRVSRRSHPKIRIIIALPTGAARMLVNALT
jgi:hypothetical protein